MKNKGFTIVEILSAIVILSLIMIIAVPTYQTIESQIKETSYNNKKTAIEASMTKFANEYLLDEVKPAGVLCDATTNSCCKRYDLHEYIVKFGIYAAEDYDEDDNPVVIDPLTNQKLNAYVEIRYPADPYDSYKLNNYSKDIEVELKKGLIKEAASPEDLKKAIDCTLED